MPNKYAGCMYEWKHRETINKTIITGLMTSGDEATVTIAEVLREVVLDVPTGSDIMKVMLNDVKLD